MLNTTLDSATALIVVDLQKSLTDQPFIHPLTSVLERTRELLQAFRGADLQVVLIKLAARAPGRTEQGPHSITTFATGWTDLLPELDQQPEDIVVTKRSWGAYVTTDLESQHRQQGVTQVVVSGVATSSGVEATACQAYEQGFDVTLALDAVTDVRKEAHDYSIRNVFPRIGEIGSSQEIISMLKTRSIQV